MKKYKKVYKLFNELGAKQQNKFLKKIGTVSENFIPIEYFLKKILKIDDTDDFLSELYVPKIPKSPSEDNSRNVTGVLNNDFTSTSTCPKMKE